jgi:hypothetical protein
LPTAPLHATDAGNSSTFEEDPFFYRTTRGFHMLTHRAVGEKKSVSVGSSGVVVVTKDAAAAAAVVAADESKSLTVGSTVARGVTKVTAPPPLGPWLCGGGHIFSENLHDWFFGESVYGGSPLASAQCNITLAPADVRIALTSRQRATIFEDSASGSQAGRRRYLYTGASVNQSEYVHSFTLVQEINLVS